MDIETKMLKYAAELHEDLRNYANLKDTDKPLLVAGILVALKERSFSIDDLVGEPKETDGEKLLAAIRVFLRNRVPENKELQETLLSQLQPVFRLDILNRIHENLNMTPLRYVTESLFEQVFLHVNSESKNDFVGQFYNEFMSYSGGDGQTLGIILTPELLTDLFCELAELKPGDVILDPCCGTAGFLIAAMQHLRKDCSLYGIEIQPYMYAISVLNLLLRDGSVEHIYNADFLKQESCLFQGAVPNVGLMNPPFSQGSTRNKNLYEICFVEKLLDSLAEGGKCVVVVPQSSLTGKTKEEQSIRERILQHHTLEGSILLNGRIFSRVCVASAIVVFTAGIPHPDGKSCRFINFKDDGYKMKGHLGRTDHGMAAVKKQELLDVWFGRMEAGTEFCIRTPVRKEDEWLHSFYYYNTEIPSEKEFVDTVNEALVYDFKAVLNGTEVILEDAIKAQEIRKINLLKREWRLFPLSSLFQIQGVRSSDKNKQQMKTGRYPYVTAQTVNFSHAGYYDTFTDEGNVLTVESAVVGFCAYQRLPFLASCHVEKLIPRFKLNPYLGLFFMTVINKNNLKKYSYGYKAAKNRLNNTMILLPVTEEKEPDFWVMEQYIKYLVFIKRREYLLKYLLPVLDE